MKSLSFLIVFFAILCGIFFALSFRHVVAFFHPGVPRTINIPTIGVHATIESVGLDSQGRMDVPQKTSDVAWYDLGVTPGTSGNAVIDGHVDTPTGAPAVFASLKKLHKGDSIEIIDNNNVSHTFVVTSVADLPTNPFPVEEVFGPTATPHLNLITCDGVWDEAKQNYSKRFVVFSTLVQ